MLGKMLLDVLEVNFQILSFPMTKWTKHSFMLLFVIVLNIMVMCGLQKKSIIFSNNKVVYLSFTD